MIEQVKYGLHLLASDTNHLDKFFLAVGAFTCLVVIGFGA